MTPNTPRRPSFTRRRLLALGGAGLLAAGLGSRAWAQAPTELKIQLNWLETGDFAALFAAEKIGADTAQGIQQVFIPGGPQVDPVQSVAGGTGLVGFGGAVSQAALARANGIPVKVIGALYRASPVGLISLIDNPIKTPQDAIGKRIGLQGGARTTWSIILKEAGISEDQMTIVPVAGDITPLVSKQVDGYWGTAVNQHISLKLQGIDNHIMTRSAMGAPEHFELIFGMENVLADNRDKVTAWLKAVIAGMEYTQANPDDVADYIVSRSPALNLRQEQQRQQVRAGLTFVNPPGLDLPLLALDEEGAKTTLAQLAGMDILPVPVTLDDLYDRSYLESARA